MNVLSSILHKLTEATMSNKELWNGSLWLNGVTTIDLSEPISKQPKGIIMEWSYFNLTSNTAEDFGYQTIYIPKETVAQHDGQGWCFLMVRNGVVGQKYFYVFDEKITGHENNQSTSYKTAGVAVNNRNWALRRVIGV